jgi:hypothetical protein
MSTLTPALTRPTYIAPRLTLAATRPLTAAGVDWPMVRRFDEAQNALNMALLSGPDYAALLPVSNRMYDLFTALELGEAGRDEIAAMIADLKCHELAEGEALSGTIHLLEITIGRDVDEYVSELRY